MKPQGRLVPTGGGDAIPLMRETMVIGRRPSCDICLPFPNVSGIHCELTFRQGVWSIRDLNSTNGLKVNGERTTQARLKPGDELSIAKRVFRVEYDLLATGQEELEDMMANDEEFAEVSLLEKAGLANHRRRDR